MNNSLQAKPLDYEDGRGAATPVDPLSYVHRALRGSYFLAIGLGCALGLAGAAIGYRADSARYKSEGSIRIAYSQPQLASQEEAAVPMTIFDAFLRAQEQKMTSKPAIEAAMREPVWRDVSSDTGDQATSRFAENLTVAHQSNSDLLDVTFTSPDAVLASAGVKAVVAVFVREYNATDQADTARLLQALDDQAADLTQKLKEIHNEGAAPSGAMDASTDVNLLQARKEQAFVNLNQTTRSLEVAEQAIAGNGPSVNAALGINPQIQQLLDHKQLVVDKINMLVNTHGLLNQNEQVRDAKAELNDILVSISNYATALRVEQAELTVDYNNLDKQLTDLSQNRSVIDAHRGLADAVIKQLGDVQTRANTLKMQQRSGQRIKIMGDGETPPVPYKDNRKYYAAACGLIGCLLPGAFIFLINISKPRYRAGDDAEADGIGGVPLLGVLPTLDTNVDDAESQAGAAHCIHQIRVMLQVGKVGRDHPVYLLTSATPGDGKTGFCSALAYSYAMAGTRTLIIDGDLVGRGLSRAFEVEGRAGLSEAVREQKLNGFCVSTEVANLWMLPAGLSGASGAALLSRPPIEKLLESARKEFDVVLIDSGPILGSVEASVIAQSATGVIFVMSRGQVRPLVHKAMQHIRALGGEVIGVVFNRASKKEFIRSSFASSVRSRQYQGTPRQHELKDILGWNLPKGVKQPGFADSHLALGPLAESVQHALSADAVV